MLAGGLISSAVLLALRARISRTQGLATTGQFDAAWGISMNHVTLVLASLQTYFLPALARAQSAEERGRHTASVLAIATLAGVPSSSPLRCSSRWFSRSSTPARSTRRHPICVGC